jgi:hypothetical protein
MILTNDDVSNLYRLVDTQDFAISIIGSEIDDCRNAQERIVTGFSDEFSCIIIDDNILPKNIRLDQIFYLTKPSKKFAFIWLKNQNSSSRAKRFINKTKISTSSLKINDLKPFRKLGTNRSLNVDDVNLEIIDFIKQYLNRIKPENINTPSNSLFLSWALPKHKKIIEKIRKKI